MTKEVKIIIGVLIALIFVVTGYAMSPSFEERLVQEIQLSLDGQQEYSLQAQNLRKEVSEVEVRIKELESELPALYELLETRLDKIEVFKQKWEKEQGKIDAYNTTLGLAQEQ